MLCFQITGIINKDLNSILTQLKFSEGVTVSQAGDCLILATENQRFTFGPPLSKDNLTFGNANELININIDDLRLLLSLFLLSNAAEVSDDNRHFSASTSDYIRYCSLYSLPVFTNEEQDFCIY
ncbi:hypothetical protein [Photobacterium sp. GB-72]|uniref:hypothetical protein n=1 Tax=Photobacterium sp. GB-72 TaxID=2022105 RepID=UPI000D177A1A|nr:hypothetical protein [Photobacterium sp. GB-72]PSV28105.1 hypothetical protein C9J40_19690 [Photobacterium sp. GB-72]